MPSFMNVETPTSEAQGEEKEKLNYLINSLKTEEAEEPQIGWVVDTTLTTILSTGRSKARVTFSQAPLTTRSSNRKKNEGSSMSSCTNGGLLLPNIPVNKDHRTLLDTLAELACEKGGMMHPTSLEDSSMTTVEGASPRRMRPRAMSEPWAVDDSYRYADGSNDFGASGVLALRTAAMMRGRSNSGSSDGEEGEDLELDPESLSSASVLSSLASSGSHLSLPTSSSGQPQVNGTGSSSVPNGHSNSSSSSSSTGNSSSSSSSSSSSINTTTPFVGIASWAARKLPVSGFVFPSAGDNAQPALVLPQVLEEGVDYSAIYNKNGRIGIYTREERQYIIQRFHDKKRRRVWKKKIRYHCRKDLADRRVRVKGRFVRASSMDETTGTAANGDNANGAGGMVVDDEDEDTADEAADLLMQMDNHGSSSSSSKSRNGKMKGMSSSSNSNSSSPDAAVAKRGRLGPSHGSAEEGMRAFWQSVQANGSSSSSNHGKGSNNSGRGQVIGEEEEDEEQREQNAEDESNEMRSSESQKTTTGLGKRFRRYTIAY